MKRSIHFLNYEVKTALKIPIVDFSKKDFTNQELPKTNEASNYGGFLGSMGLSRYVCYFIKTQ